MNISSFIVGFIGAFTGLVVYQGLIKPLCLFLYRQAKARLKAWRERKANREFLEGKEWAWAQWGTDQMSYNAMQGFFMGQSLFARGVTQALKEIWPYEQERRIHTAIDRRTR